MRANTPNSKPAGSIATTWELRTYDVWGNASDGWQVNDTFSAGTVELRIPRTRYNVGTERHVCRNADCKSNGCGVIPTVTHNSETGATRQRCPECWQDVTTESQEFVSAYPTDRQIKRAFGVTCRIETGGDDMRITVNRTRDGYPIGEMHCTSHASLSPVRKAEAEV